MGVHSTDSVLAVEPDSRFAENVGVCLLIRAFEEQLLRMFSAGQVDGTTHTSIGQEVNAVGVLSHCDDADIAVSNHRCHAHFIARTGETRALLAEIMGLPDGVCAGIGGSQHLCVPGKFYSNGIQGGIAPFAVGLALAKAVRGEPGVVTVFIGDGTLGEGVLYEALNLAKLKSARVLFVVEDNGIAQTTASELTVAGSIAGRFEAFSIPVQNLSYPSLDDVYAASGSAFAAIRAGDGPQALVIRNPRLGPHSKGDDTRSAEVIASERSRDPFIGFTKHFSAESLAEMNETARLRVESDREHLVAARAAPNIAGIALLAEDCAPTSDAASSAFGHDASQGRFNDRLRQGLTNLLQDNAFAVMLGEDIGWPYGGAFKVAGDLSVRFEDRVWQMPISEAGMTGVAGGLSVGGCLPIVEIMFGDFSTLIADQVINHFAKFRQMYAGQMRTPGIIRLPMGGRRGYGPTHSQSIEKIFIGVPGLRVVAPSLVHPVEGMLAACAGQPYPTMFIENKLDYARSIEFDSGMYRGFSIRSRGHELGPTLSFSLTDFDADQFSIYTYGGMLPAALDAIEELAIEHEICGRVVCPSLISPLPAADLLAELAGSFVLIAEEGVAEGGWSAEAAYALGTGKSGLTIDRLGAKRHCIPAATALEKSVLPSVREMVESVLSRF